MKSWRHWLHHLSFTIKNYGKWCLHYGSEPPWVTVSEHYVWEWQHFHHSTQEDLHEVCYCLGTRIHMPVVGGSYVKWSSWSDGPCQESSLTSKKQTNKKHKYKEQVFSSCPIPEYLGPIPSAGSWSSLLLMQPLGGSSVGTGIKFLWSTWKTWIEFSVPGFNPL